jgi:hypothetical protein
MAVMSGLRPSQLAERLLEASTVSDVEQIIAAIPNKRWEPFGGKRGNWAQINAVSEPSDAIVERVTNAFDALLERDVELTGNRTFSSPRQAVETLFGIPGGRIANLTDDMRRRELARQIVVSARDSGVDKRPSIVIRDDGIGQHPDAFPTTLLSLNEENKRTRFYLMGAYGWGGASSLQFARYTVFVSRRNRGLLGSGQTDQVGWSIVRYNALEEDMSAKHGLFEYLALDEGGRPVIPRFDPVDLPRDRIDWTGTVCSCIEYELSRYSDLVSRPDHSLWLLFNAVLFDPILPFLIREERSRWQKANATVTGEGIVVNGSAARLSWDSRKKKEETRRVDYQHSWSVPINGSGSATVKYFVLHEKGDPKKDWEPIETYVNPEQAVTITHNGQRQGSWRRELFNQLGLLSLAKFMVVHVDCDDLDWRAKRNLFTTTRDRLKDNPLTAQLREAVATALRSDVALRALDQRRKAEALSRRSARHAEKIRQLLQRAIEAQREGEEVLYRKLMSNNPDLPVYTDQSLVKPEPREDGDPDLESNETDLEYPAEPSEIRVLNPVVQIPAGGKAVIRLFVNAIDGYISPGAVETKFRGVITRSPDQFKVGGYSELRNGHMRCTVSASDAQVGDKGRIVFTVTTTNGLPLVDEADLVAVEPPMKRVKATTKTKPGSQQGPNVEEVHREDWDKFDLGPSRVARVEHNSPSAGLTTFYVNWDYPPLDERLMAERKANVDEIDPYKRKFCAAMAYSAWMQDSELGSADGAPTQDERDSELRRAARMFLFSEFLKDREV